jgi:hypothetical protein
MMVPRSNPIISEGPPKGSAVGGTAPGVGTVTGLMRVQYRYPSGLAAAPNADCVVANTFGDRERA